MLATSCRSVYTFFGRLCTPRFDHTVLFRLATTGTVDHPLQRGHPLNEHESIAVNHLIGSMRKPLPHLTALEPDHLGQLPRRVIGDPLADHLAVDGDLDRIAGVEVAADADHPDRQKAGTALAQHPRRPGIDRESAMDRLRVLEPELEARRPPLPGGETSASRPTRGGGIEGAGAGAVADRRRDP